MQCLKHYHDKIVWYLKIIQRRNGSDINSSPQGSKFDIAQAAGLRELKEKYLISKQ